MAGGFATANASLQNVGWTAVVVAKATANGAAVAAAANRTIGSASSDDLATACKPVHSRQGKEPEAARRCDC